jgi:putative phosphoesterase
MFMRIGLLSDTHGFLDEAIMIHFSQCDEIWHAGDFGSSEVLDKLSAFKPVRAVFGNVDGPEIRSRLPEDLDWTTGNVRVYMTHIGGYPGRYDARAKRELVRRKPDLFICGHSHIARVMRDRTMALLHINPGASGHSGWHTKRTAVRLHVEADQITKVELIELGPRGRNLSS